MKKVTLIVLSLLILVFLFAITLSVQAGPPERAKGTWLYTPYVVDEKAAGCNSHMTTYEDGEWSGTFAGTSREEGRVIIHCQGNWSFQATVYFDGEVDGRSGSLVMTANGSRPDATADWFGHWTIISGTEELANLRGHGTFWGPGWLGDPDVPGVIKYKGKVHFEPN